MAIGELVFEFGDFRLDVRERRLLRVGQPVPLTRKALETLRVLVERSGRLVTKDELMQYVWPDTVVEENNLNQNISALRRVLGEHTTGLRFIETIPGATFVPLPSRNHLLLGHEPAWGVFLGELGAFLGGRDAACRLEGANCTFHFA